MVETPGPAELLADFANTLEIDGDEVTERIGSTAALGDWLRGRGLLREPAGGSRRGSSPSALDVAVSDDDLVLAHALRNGLRAAMASHHDQTDLPAREGSLFDAAAARLPLRVEVASGRPRLVPAADGVRAALGALLVAVEDSVADGSWTRLKLCRSAGCQWAFHDTTKNQSRQWCSMRVCGNRQKTKAYRQRQRTQSPGHTAPAATARRKA